MFTIYVKDYEKLYQRRSAQSPQKAFEIWQHFRNEYKPPDGPAALYVVYKTRIFLKYRYDYEETCYEYVPVDSVSVDDFIKAMVYRP
jgi:hypothetical protein